MAATGLTAVYNNASQSVESAVIIIIITSILLFLFFVSFLFIISGSISVSGNNFTYNDIYCTIPTYTLVRNVLTFSRVKCFTIQINGSLIVISNWLRKQGNTKILTYLLVWLRWQQYMATCLLLVETQSSH